MKISNILTKWYKKNHRELPWRETTDPYLVWLSEIILQQTRVDQGLAYYHRFAEMYPTVDKLASAPEDEVLKLWQGLGYYSRARNLHAAAGEVMSRFNGIFPSAYNDLISLKGIGSYTASAIASICSGEPVAVVDGNVSRVVSRLFMISSPVNSAEGAGQVAAAASELLNPADPGTHNQAMMELGALICKPRNPKCDECPLSNHCRAYAAGEQTNFPVKLKKKEVSSRYFTYFLLRSGDRTCMVKRTGKDIWKSLYEFPMVETENAPGEEAFPGMLRELLGETQQDFTITRTSPVIVHQLTHRKIHARFVHATLADPAFRIPGCITPKLEEIGDFPIPRLIDRYLEGTEF